MWSEKDNVSIIIPCFNEEHTIQLVLESVYKQSFPLERLQVIIADGGSTDDTRVVISAYLEDHPDLNLILIDNPLRIIPAALNIAIAAATNEIIIRLDAHCIPATDYIERSVTALNLTGAANVGGRWLVEPGADSCIARGIARAASHPLGAGDAKYRFSEQAGIVDTVPFGAFPKAWLDKVGPYNEQLLTNEDYEYNLRIRHAGGKIWFDPEIKAVYFARKNLHGLARQYLRYGFWKAIMARRNLSSLRWRQVLPPVFVLAFIMLLIGSIWFSALRWLLLFQMSSYFGVTGIVALLLAWKERQISYLISFPISIWTMHFCWGSAFVFGMIFGGRNAR